MHSIDSWSERFRILFYIFVSNFILPVIMNIAEIIVIFCDTNFLRGFIVVTVNCYVTILGVLLATIWAQGSAKGKLPGWAGLQEGRRTTRMTSLQFASRQVPNAEIQMSRDGNDEFEFIEDKSGPSVREKGAVVHSAQASDLATHNSFQEEIREKTSSGSNGGRSTGPSQTTLCESVHRFTAGEPAERVDTRSPESIYSSYPELFDTTADPIPDAV